MARRLDSENATYGIYVYKLCQKKNFALQGLNGGGNISERDGATDGRDCVRAK